MSRLKLFSKAVFKLSGWTLDDHLKADFTQCVMLAIPHTSNWDFIYARCAFALMGIPVRFTVKKEWMRFPFSLIFGSLGGIAIDRSPKKEGEERISMVEAMTNLFNGQKELVIMITPEGTRSKREKWKTGFYHVATGAKVPIALGYLDYKTKTAGVGKVITPSGDMDKDMREIMDFYRPITPKFPEKFSLDLDYV